MAGQALFTPNAGSHALVIGGSMAGLVAGRALADHFGQVTIVERDRFPEGPEFRRGVPQARHVHVLLARGQMILEQLFPGLGGEVAAAGAPAVDWAADGLWFSFGGWKPRFRSGIVTRTCHRDLLEWAVRRRLAGYPQVRFVAECDVTGLLADTGKTRVTGVRLRSRHRSAPDSDGEEELSVDLIVDASGRDSRTPRWLEMLGYAPPEETSVNSFLGYASRCYRRPKDLQADWKLVLLQATPPAGARGGVTMPIDRERWMVTLAGAARDYPPTDETGFLEFARSLPRPVLYEAIRDAAPLSPVYGYRRTENRLRHYERLRRWPEGLVVIGDAVCAFNPVYGQGMTVGAQGALELHRCLRDQRRRRPDGDLTGLAQRFRQQLAKINATPWMLATGEDFRYPGTEGGRPGRVTRLLHRYMDRVMISATKNPAVHRAFIEVLHLLKPATALFQPSIAIQVLGGSYQPARAGRL